MRPFLLSTIGIGVSSLLLLGQGASFFPDLLWRSPVLWAVLAFLTGLWRPSRAGWNAASGSAMVVFAAASHALPLTGAVRGAEPFFELALAGLLVFLAILPREDSLQLRMLGGLLFMLSNPFQGEPFYPWAYAGTLAAAGLLEPLIRGRRPGMMDAPVGAFALAVAASAAASVSVSDGLRVLSLLGVYGAVYLIAADLGWERLRPVMTGWLTLQAALAGMLVYGTLRRCLEVGLTQGIAFRVWALDSPPNYVAFALVFACFIAVALAGRDTAGRSITRIEGVLFMAAIVLSYARISLVAFGAGMLTMAVAAFGPVRRTLVPLAMLVAVLLAVAIPARSLLPTGIRQRFEQFAHPERDTRFRVWIAAMPMALDSPLLGPGPQTKYLMLNEYSSRRGFGVSRQFLRDIHNLWLEVATSLGSAGFLCLNWVLAAWAWAAWKLRSRHRALAGLLAASCVAFLADALANVRLWIPENGHLVWLMLGLAGALPARSATASRIVPLLFVLMLTPAFARHVSEGHLLAARRAPDPLSKAALDHLEFAGRREPWNGHIDFMCGAWYAANGQPVPAELALRRAIAKSPRNVLYHSRLASLLTGAGRLPEALAEMREVLRLQPLEISGRYNQQYGEYLLANGDRREALRQLYLALVLDPSRGRLPMYRSNRWLLLDVLDQIWTDVGKPDALGYPLKEHLVYQLWTLEALHEDGRIQELVGWAGTYWPLDPDIAILAARSSMRLGMLAEAGDWLCVAESSSPPTSILRNEWGMWFALQGRFEEAIAQFELAFTQRESLVLDNLMAATMLERCHRALGHSGEAGRWQERREFIARDWQRQRWDAEFHVGGFDHATHQVEAWGLEPTK